MIRIVNKISPPPPEHAAFSLPNILGKIQIMRSSAVPLTAKEIILFWVQLAASTDPNVGIPKRKIRSGPWPEVHGGEQLIDLLLQHCIFSN